MLNKVVGPGETTIKGPIDLEPLRRDRAQPFHPATLRAEMYALEYANFVGWPNDRFRDEPIQSIDETRALFAELVQRRRDLGIDQPPSG